MKISKRSNLVSPCGSISRRGMEEIFFERERGQVVQCSCCSRSLAELNPLAPSRSLPATFRPSEIGDILIFYSGGGVGRVLRSLLPPFLAAFLPAPPLPLPFSSNSRLILLFCITKDKSNLDLSLSPPSPLCEKWPPSLRRTDRRTDRRTVRASDSAGGAQRVG